MTESKPCPDCPDQRLVPVQVLDREMGSQRVGFEFAGSSVKPTAWSGYKKRIQGVVHAMMCPGCGRVLWYAMSRDAAQDMFALEANAQLAEAGQLALAEPTTGDLTVAEEAGQLSESSE